jgi:hypothetical protein
MTTISIKYFFLIIFCALFAIPIHLQAQDLIVTNEGDSINCKITKVKSDNIYFVFKYKEEIRNTLLPVDQVAFYQKNYYSTSEVPKGKIFGNEIYPHFRVTVNGGWSYRTASLSSSISSDFKDYWKNLKSGFHYELGVSYYFTEIFGVGLKYNEFLSSNEMGDVYVEYPDETTEYGNMSDNIRIKFIGPSFSCRLLNSSKKNCFLIDLAWGYMDYRDKRSILNMSASFKGGTFGTYMSIGYDIGIYKNLALGFQISALTGILTQFTFSDGTSTQTIKLDKDMYENFARIDLSIGLRFNK